MTIQTLREFLLWCAVINIGILMCWGLMFLLVHDWIYRMHGKFFKLSVETFDAIHYSGIAVYKIAIFMFSIVPYLALLIVE